MTSLPPPQDICLLAESRQLWQVDPKSDQCTELSEYETIRKYLSRYCRFSLGARTGICFNDFNQDILLTHTQELRVLEINRGFCLLQPCVAEVVGWVFSVSQRDSKPFGLPLLSPALPFGFCPPAIIWTIPVYGSSKIIKQYYAHRLSSASNMQRLPPRRWYRNVSELHRNTISTALWTCVLIPFFSFCSYVLNSGNFFQFTKRQRKESPAKVTEAYRDVLRKRFHKLPNSHRRIYRKRHSKKRIITLSLSAGQRFILGLCRGESISEP